MIKPEATVQIRIWQLEQLLELMATYPKSRENPENRERARRLWMDILRLSTLIASEA